MIYETLFNETELSVSCTKHSTAVEFWANDDAQSPLDVLQLICPGLGEEIGRIRERMRGLDTEARLILGRRYLRDNPDETRDMPSDWIPTERWTFEQFPGSQKDRIRELDAKEETLTEECRNSWVVRLTSTKNYQKGDPSKD
jgi:hypothetical protein